LVAAVALTTHTQLRGRALLVVLVAAVHPEALSATAALAALAHPVKETLAAQDILVGPMALAAAVAVQVLLARMPLYHRLALAARDRPPQSLEHP
jgi:hypothetical protein